MSRRLCRILDGWRATTRAARSRRRGGRCAWSAPPFTTRARSAISSTCGRPGGRCSRAPLGETYENIRDFFVVREEGRLVGCAALHITWSDLAELKSLAVDEESQASGYGRALAEACVAEGRSLGLQRIFALTYRPGFFERLGWEQADVMSLPRKVWNECYRCPKFPGCEEIALVLDLDEAPDASGPLA